MPNLIFLFMTLIFLVTCEYGRLPVLLTARVVSRANFQSRRGETTVFSEFFLASVQAYPASRGPSIFLDKSLPDLSRKIEGLVLAG